MFKGLGGAINGLHSAALVLGGFALVSQLLAVIRDRVFAHMFGTGPVLDAYYAAFRIPDLLFIMIGSVVSVSVAVPLLSHAIEKSKEEAKILSDRVFTFFGVAMITASVLAFLLMPLLVYFLFPGFPSTTRYDVIELSRIMLLSPFFLGISSLFSSIIQVERRFLIYSISPLLYNLGIIGGALLLYPFLGVPGLAWGVALGAFLHMAFQLPYVSKTGFFPKPRRFEVSPLLESVVRPSIPRTLTLSLGQILFTIMLSAATLMEEGSVTLLSFANNMYSVPVSLIGVSYSISAFSLLAKNSAQHNDKEFEENVSRSLRWILFFSIPFTILFITFSEQIIGFFLGSGRFDVGDQEKAGQILLYLSIGIFFQSVSLLITRAFYALGETMKPFFPYAAGFVLSLILIVFAYDESNLAQAFTAGSILTSLMLLREYSKLYTLGTRGLLEEAWELLKAWIPGGAVGFWTYFALSLLLSEVGFLGIVLPTLGGILAGGAVGLWLLSKSRLPEAEEFLALLKRSKARLWKAA